MPRFNVYEDKAGEWRWRMRADNNEIIAVSEGYTTKQNCVENIRLIKKTAATTPIYDASKEPVTLIEK